MISFVNDDVVWTPLSLFLLTYGLSLISSIFNFQKFRKQICGALELYNQMAPWEYPKLKMYPFSYTLYKSKDFAPFTRMSLWLSGSMLGSYAKDPWIKSKSSKIFNFFYVVMYFFYPNLLFFLLY